MGQFTDLSTELINLNSNAAVTAALGISNPISDFYPYTGNPQPSDFPVNWIYYRAADGIQKKIVNWQFCIQSGLNGLFQVGSFENSFDIPTTRKLNAGLNASVAGMFLVPEIRDDGSKYYRPMHVETETCDEIVFSYYLDGQFNFSNDFFIVTTLVENQSTMSKGKDIGQDFLFFNDAASIEAALGITSATLYLWPTGPILATLQKAILYQPPTGQQKRIEDYRIFIDQAELPGLVFAPKTRISSGTQDFLQGDSRFSISALALIADFDQNGVKYYRPMDIENETCDEVVLTIASMLTPETITASQISTQCLIQNVLQPA